MGASISSLAFKRAIRSLRKLLLLISRYRSAPSGRVGGAIEQFGILLLYSLVLQLLSICGNIRCRRVSPLNNDMRHVYIDFCSVTLCSL